MRRERPEDTEQQLFRLERKHRQLKQRISELDRRLHLTSSEEWEVTHLKKRRLATKDAITSLRTGLDA